MCTARQFLCIIKAMAIKGNIKDEYEMIVCEPGMCGIGRGGDEIIKYLKQ